MLIDQPDLPKDVALRRNGGTESVTLTPGREDGRLSLGLYPHVSSRIGRVQRGKPAYRAGIKSGAVVEAINDTTVTSYEDVRRMVNASPGQPLYIRWSQDGLAHADTIVPVPKDALKRGSTSEFVTVGIIGIGPYAESRREGFLSACASGFRTANATIMQLIGYVRQLFTGQMGIKTLGGPILIYQMAGDVANWGFDSLLLFLAFFNINLCIFNLLPILPFDGGHLALLGWEGVTRRPLNKRVREWMMQGGFVLIILLMGFVVVMDLARCTGSAPGGF
jgi:regulator of sigma E protease